MNLPSVQPIMVTVFLLVVALFTFAFAGGAAAGREACAGTGADAGAA